MSKIIPLRSSKNEIEAVRQFVQTICIFKFNDVTGRELDLLCEIIRCEGVNEKSKKSFMINYKTSAANFGQLVKRLSDKGILIDKAKRNGKDLAEDFVNFTELYLKNNKSNYIPLVWEINS